MLENCKDVLTVRETKEILRVGFNKIYELLRNGDIKSLRVGNKIIIPKSAVIEYLQTAA
ncbi:MAG: helix-turn-helix domain-containing protein [Hominilimicola sp.]